MSQQLYIPELSDRIILTKDWTFTLFKEFRNYGLWNSLNLSNDKDINKVTYTLAKNTILYIDRIYIRRGKDDYSSITFRIIPETEKYSVIPLFTNNTKLIRFWAALEDVNKIYYEKINTTLIDIPWYTKVSTALKNNLSIKIPIKTFKVDKQYYDENQCVEFLPLNLNILNQEEIDSISKDIYALVLRKPNTSSKNESIDIVFKPIKIHFKQIIGFIDKNNTTIQFKDNLEGFLQYLYEVKGLHVHPHYPWHDGSIKNLPSYIIESNLEPNLITINKTMIYDTANLYDELTSEPNNTKSWINSQLDYFYAIPQDKYYKKYNILYGFVPEPLVSINKDLVIGYIKIKSKVEQ